MQQPITYALTSLIPSDMNDIFWHAKTKFDLFVKQEKTQKDNYILKNLAHITLVTMFKLNDPENEVLISAHLEKISFQPIPIEAKEVALFISPKHGNVVVIKIKKTPELKQFHFNLLQAIEGLATTENPEYEKDGFTPHITVFYNVPDEKVKEAISYVKRSLIPLQYTLTNFQFMKSLPNIRSERSLIKTYQSL